MKAVVVFESLWGNTAAVARAVAQGIGPEARCLSTDEASPEAIADADLVVAGAPVLGFHLGGEQIRAAIARDEAHAPKPPDLSHPSLRSWLDGLPQATGRSAAFETRMLVVAARSRRRHRDRVSRRAGLPTPIAKAQKFVVEDKYGPTAGWRAGACAPSR